MSSINFEILVDDSLYNLTTEGSAKHMLLGQTNSFEDGLWNYKRFEKYIFNKMYLTALSAREREALIQNEDVYSIIEESCKNIRLIDAENDIGKGSEIAEILLYGIMSDHFKALPIVPKIYYKQNRNDYAKGADGVHIVLDKNDEDYTIWYGEAKFYKNVTATELNTIANSVYNSLTTEKIKKENSIITDIKDLDILLKEDNRRESILTLLSQDASVDDIKIKLHIPIMILYECKEFENINRLTDNKKETLRKEYLKLGKQYFTVQNSVCNRIFNYEEVTFHLILFPVPNKKQIVDSFCSKVKTIRG